MSDVIGILSTMRMLRTFEDLKTFNPYRLSKPAFRQHTMNGILNDSYWKSFLKISKILNFVTSDSTCSRAFILCMSEIIFHPVLFSGYLHLFSVDNNYVITNVHCR